MLRVFVCIYVSASWSLLQYKHALTALSLELHLCFLRFLRGGGGGIAGGINAIPPIRLTSQAGHHVSSQALYWPSCSKANDHIPCKYFGGGVDLASAGQRQSYRRAGRISSVLQ